MGLSLRDLQEAQYFILGKVLSVSVVNLITLKVQQQLESRGTGQLNCEGRKVP